MDEDDNGEQKRDHRSIDNKIDGRSGFDCEEYELERPDYLLSCELVKKDGPKRYTVRIVKDEEQVLVEKYSEDLIAIRMKRYSSDQHLESAFRHVIEIEDDIFPEQWRVFQ